MKQFEDSVLISSCLLHKLLDSCIDQDLKNEVYAKIKKFDITDLDWVFNAIMDASHEPMYSRNRDYLVKLAFRLTKEGRL